MKLIILRDPEHLAIAAATLLRDRVLAKPDLAMAMPAGRTPRRMYALLREWQQSEPVDFSRMRVFSVDELAPPAPAEGYFWRQVSAEFLCWAAVAPEGCHPFRVGASDLEVMCREYEDHIGRLGGLDLIMLGLGPNGHLASNEPGAPFDTLTRPVALLGETVGYILTDEITLALSGGKVSDRAVTLGLGTILAAREVVLLVSGAAKRRALRRVIEGSVVPEVPASILQRHPRCTILADRAAAEGDES